MVDESASGASRAGDLAALVPPLPAGASCERARDAFEADSSLFAVAIVDAESRPIGLINRFKFLERLASRFGRELVLKKPVSLLMEGEPLIIDESTPIDELGNRLLAEQNRYVFDGFIVTRAGAYAGLGTGLDLIRALTERRHAELEQMALHDMLTGLPNRALFEQRLAAALAAAGTAQSVAVLFIDLDRFKEINDSLGHRFGDLVLCGVSQRMRAAVRKSDVVARLSGDEFAVVIPDLVDPEDADTIATVLLGSCGAPLAIDGREVVVSCSIGVALYPQHGHTQEALLRAADTAQYHAKEVRNSWQRYRPEMQEWRSATPGLGALRQALETGRLEVHYQPIVDIPTGQIGSVEALVRWTHDDVAVAAGDIVSLAEESGLIVPLTEFVLRTALRQMREWDETLGRTDLRVAVNISAVQVAEGGLVAMADRLLAECQFDPRRLDFELTERAAMRASPSAVSSLDALRSRGITLTLDDFGTGYSALSRLERLPIDAMKIDKSFLEEAGGGENGVIAKAIIAMGHALGMTIVGEGVETEAQWEFLKREGCDFAQGYLLGQPSPGPALVERLARPSAQAES
jgi:diguanylate cyclase (GGDEF)-like protein